MVKTLSPGRQCLGSLIHRAQPAAVAAVRSQVVPAPTPDPVPVRPLWGDICFPVTTAVVGLVRPPVRPGLRVYKGGRPVESWGFYGSITPDRRLRVAGARFGLTGQLIQREWLHSR